MGLFPWDDTKNEKIIPNATAAVEMFESALKEVIPYRQKKYVMSSSKVIGFSVILTNT